MSNLPPGLLLIVGGLLACLLPGRWRAAWCLVLPVASLLHMSLAVPPGTLTQWNLFDLSLVPVRADRLTEVWGWIFHVAALLGTLYSLHQRDRWEQSMALVYAGAAIACLFAGDLLTLFVFWELTAIASVFLVWAGRTDRSYRAGMRYLIIQVTSGVLLLAAAIFQGVDHGSLTFGQAGEVGVFRNQWGDLPSTLLLLAFGIKAAFPLLHAWLPDAYPEASPGGTVFLSAFTTKLAIYALVRGFAGYSPLITVGCVMALVPLIYALLEDDVRRSLAYCLNNQLGFMVVAAGVGSPLAVNGAAAHAVAHILYKGLLFMATGAVLFRTGTVKASRLGGLAFEMPLTFICYLVGAAAISAPLFCGYVTKSLTLNAVAEAHHQTAWICLLMATAGVFFVCGLRIPCDVFAGQAGAPVTRSLPWNMRAAMVASAIGCLLVGLFPHLLYHRLPYPVDYHPYTLRHVAEPLQLMAFAGLAFLVCVKLGWYPFFFVGQLLDVDWFYRRALPRALGACRCQYDRVSTAVGARGQAVAQAVWQGMGQQLSGEGSRGRFTATGQMAMAAAVMLVIYLLLYYR